jgi:hypothetical protein
MASCPACGANITHAKTADGENVPLEKYTDTSGPDRYRIIDAVSPPVVEKVPPSSTLDCFPDHRLDCPDYGNGLVT